MVVSFNSVRHLFSILELFVYLSCFDLEIRGTVDALRLWNRARARSLSFISCAGSVFGKFCVSLRVMASIRMPLHSRFMSLLVMCKRRPCVQRTAGVSVPVVSSRSHVMYNSVAFSTSQISKMLGCASMSHARGATFVTVYTPGVIKCILC